MPSDAIGVTRGVTGTIVLAATGSVVRDQSNIVVDLGALQSNESQRDTFIKRSVLQTDRFPKAELVPTEIRGLASPLPTTGEATFEIVGDFTVHGVTKSSTWNVTAKLGPQEVTGSATTTFKFADFGMEVPRVARVLSIEEPGKLEIDFHAVREN